ncbi:TrgA family protein [Limimaricola hongkongensis]|uniref:Tellurite resistance protein TrgA n=1 Tax=Limimaricola hongkongensis DSM 17492 TaxID=1122180 RepID=A0A017HDD5_9RHOB|nr:TrgA family protein [Limimaricola hongkongensis]EYD72497.1 Tellurite resistance protein TrgA [Limimaricola hongkongensis DSM 17492]
MPTAAKLVAALLFAALGFVASELALPLLDGMFRAPHASTINAGIGALVGWFVAGPRAGGGVLEGVSNGLTAALIGAALILVTHGVIFMMRTGMRGRYRDPVDALEAMVRFMLDSAQRLATPQQIAMLVLGGIGIGLLLELTQSRAA